MSGSTNQLAEARARRALQAMRLPAGHLERASSTNNEIHLTERHVVRVSTQLNHRLYREALLYEHLPAEPWAPSLVGVGSRSGTDFVIVERKPGQPLAHAWPFLSADARRRAVAELAACMRAIHATPSPDPSAVPPLHESLYLLGPDDRRRPESSPTRPPLSTSQAGTEHESAPATRSAGAAIPVPAALLPAALLPPETSAPPAPPEEPSSADGPAEDDDDLGEGLADGDAATVEPENQPDASEVSGPLIDGLRRLASDANADRGVISTALDFVTANANHLVPHDRSHLVHGDLTFENILHHQDGVSAIVDYEWCRGGPADLDLDVLLRCCAMPGRHVAPRFEDLTRSEDYAPVPGWLAEDYPELFATPGLSERLTLYAMAFDVRDALDTPLPRHRADVDDDHPYNRLVGLVSSGGHVATFLDRIGLSV